MNTNYYHILTRRSSMVVKPCLGKIISCCLVLAWSLAAEVVTIDFANDQGTMVYRASGFLHGMTATTPADSITAPLKPQLMRYSPWEASAYSRTISMGAKFQMCLSDGSGYSSLPGTNGNWSEYENYVRNAVNEAVANHQQVEWDIWNEPDATQFWSGTIPQFNETWRRAVVVIRSVDPNAVIVGPSIAGFNFTWLKNFLQYAKTNNVLPTAVSWHEIGGNSGVRGIAMNVRAMRTYLAAQGMNVPKIYINELTSSTNHHNPGLIVRNLTEIERAKVDGACKSCWDETTGSNCANNSLDGLVTNGTGYPRSAWWAYKSYADITGRMVGITPGPIPFSVDGIAGQDSSKGEARAVLGRYAGSGSLDVKLVNLGSVPYLTKTGTIHVTAKRIPNSGESRLIGPTTTIDADYKIANNVLQFTIADFPDSNAYAIHLTPGTATGVKKGVRRASANPAWKVLQTAGTGIMVKATLADMSETVSLSICDIQGRLVQHLSGESKGGEFTAVWDGSKHPAGMYLFSLDMKNGRSQKKVAIIS